MSAQQRQNRCFGWMTAPSIPSRSSKRMNSISLQASLSTARSRANAAAASGSPSICAARGPCAKQSRTNRSSVRSLPGSVQRKPGRHAVLHLAAKPVQPCRDPPRVLLVGKNLPRAEEIQLSLLGRADLGGDLLPGVALEHAAQKARKAAVIAVGCVGHMRFVRHCSASCRTVRRPRPPPCRAPPAFAQPGQRRAGPWVQNHPAKAAASPR